MRRLVLLLSLACLPMLADVIIDREDNKIVVKMDGQPFTTFYYGEDIMKPYLHPLRDAEGVIMTRRYPMEQGEGETTDHPHHRGLWFAHGDINGLDYWSSDPLNKRPDKVNPRIEFKEVVETASEGDTARIRVQLNYLNEHAKPLLEEDRLMVFRKDGNLRIIDFDILLIAVEDVTFGDTKEGMFAIRLHPGLEEPDPKGKSPKKPARTLKMVSSEGKKGSKQVWGSRANWVDYSGTVEGKTRGIAIFDHPENYGHPTYWHARGYGLFAANPFGEKDFTGDKERDGSHHLKTGDKIRFRYRVVIHPGNAQQIGLDRLYQQYASQQPVSTSSTK